MLLAVFIAGCSPDSVPAVTGDDPTAPPGPTDPAPTTPFVDPVIDVVWTPNANESAPLGYRLELTSDLPVTVDIVIADDLGERFVGPFAEAATHDLWLHHWRVGRTADVTVTATTASGGVATWGTTVDAPALPADFPGLVANVSNPAAMEPGVTVLAPTGSGPDGPSYLAAVDATGVVVWWYSATGSVHSIDQTPEGHVRFMRNRDGVFQVDLRGELIEEWHPRDASPSGVQVEADRLHHDLIDGPDGHFLALSIEGRTLESYPLSELEPALQGEAFVAGDVIVEFDPLTGALVAQWSMLDLLDPGRIGWDAVAGDYWEDYFRQDTKDWTHGNALQYDAANDRIWFCARHQDAVVAIDRGTGTVQGILANDSFWGPSWAPLVFTQVGPGLVPYHQHGIDLGPDGTILVFDNGNARTTPPQVPTVMTTSRASEWRVDFDAMTAEEVWAYDDPRGLYASSLGNVMWLPTRDHVLIDYGNLPRVAETDPGALILEVTRTEPAEVVFELAVFRVDPALGNATAYRAHRWATLQPIPGR